MKGTLGHLKEQVEHVLPQHTVKVLLESDNELCVIPVRMVKTPDKGFRHVWVSKDNFEG